MTEFEKWWNSSDHSRVIGQGNPYEAAQEAWDAALSWAADKFLEIQDHD